VPLAVIMPRGARGWKNVIFCGDCGLSNTGDAGTCRGCGASLHATAPPAEDRSATGAVPAPVPPPRRDGKRRVVGVLAAVLIVGGVVAFVADGRTATSATDETTSSSAPAATGTFPDATSTPSTAPPSLSARTAWTAVLAGHPGATSSPVGPLTTSAVVAEGRTAFAYRFISGAWQQRGALELDIATDTSAPVRVADLTGDREDDFLIALAGADAPFGAVVSAAGGSWQVVPFVWQYQGTRPTASTPNTRIAGGALYSDVNDCQPDCADGHYSTTAWSYDEMNREFYPNTGPGTPGGSGE